MKLQEEREAHDWTVSTFIFVLFTDVYFRMLKLCVSSVWSTSLIVNLFSSEWSYTLYTQCVGIYVCFSLYGIHVMVFFNSWVRVSCDAVIFCILCHEN